MSVKPAFFALLLTALAGPALAGDIPALSKAASVATAKSLQIGHLCAPIMGDSALAAGRAEAEMLLRLTGLAGDDLTKAADDADKQAGAMSATQPPLRSLIGKNGVTEASLAQSCTELLNAATRDADVALARLRKAMN